MSEGIVTLGTIHPFEKIAGKVRSRRVTGEIQSLPARDVVPTGSAGLDDVRLSVNRVQDPCFGFNIAPQTWTHTTLGGLKPGSSVKLGADSIARCLERLLSARIDAT